MKTCKVCGKEIAKSAKVCPNCGHKNGLPIWAKILIIVVIIFGCIIGCVGSCTNSVNDAIEETADGYKDINGKTSFKVNETFQNKYEKITLLETDTNFTKYGEFFEPDTGKKYVMLKFEVEDISAENDEVSISSLEFNAFADGISADQAYSIGNDSYNDLSATLTSGKKAIGYIFFEVPEDAKNITVSYNGNFWLDGDSVEFIVAE